MGMKRWLIQAVGVMLVVGGCGRPAPEVSAPPVQEAARPAAPSPEPAPAPATAPATASASKEEPGRTYKVAVAYSATGDLLGDGRPLVAEVLAEEPHPFGYWPETITLQIREPGGTVLATAELQTTRPTGLDLVDMAQSGKPYIVVRSRREAVSDHMAHLHVYRFDEQGLHLEGTFDGWFGSSNVGTRDGRPVARIRYRYQQKWNDYLPFDLITKPAPRLLRTLTIGWQDGHVGVVADEFTRLAYPLFGNTEMEKPLRPEALALWQKGEELLVAGKPAEAVAPLRQALAMEPLYPDALNSLAYAYALQGNWEESRSAAARAVELNVWHPFAQFNLGVALLQLGKSQEAETPLSTATGLQLNRWEPHYYLGLSYERQGKREKALTEFQKAAAIQPGAPGVQDALQRLTQ